MWERKVPVRWGDFHLDAPVPLLGLLLCAALLVFAYMRLDSQFPADGEGFDGAPRTLGSIAEALRRNATADIPLRGGAESLVVSQPIRGACTAALIENLYETHRDSLTYRREGSRYILERRQ